MYVLKFRGAGQGPKALAAELLVGELARVAGLPVPTIVLVDLDPDLARTEPDSEIQTLIRASAGVNLAVDYLPGSVTFDPVTETPPADLASAIVWFDAFVTNVDRTARNTNLLMWHRRLWLIDHGAALYFHHDWDDDFIAHSRTAFPMIKDHVLLPFAAKLEEADRLMAERITRRATRQEIRRFTLPISLVASNRGKCFSRRRCVRDLVTYDYAIIRVVPKVERAEFVNVGVIVSCPRLDLLLARIELDERRLIALDPTVDLELVQTHLAAIPTICVGGEQAGPIGR